MRKIALIIVLLVLTSASLLAQRRLFIRGHVLNENKQAVIASIYVKGTTSGTTSNDQGFYEIGVEVPDTLILEFSAIGYHTEQHTIIHNHEKAFILNVILKRDEKQLDFVEIRAMHQQTSTMISINKDNARFMPDASGSGIESLLKASGSGVSSSNELSSQYSVRGGNFDENSVYVNNIEVYRPLLIRAGQQEGLSFINPDMVKSVEFSAGGFDAQFGDKMSSVLNVTYKKPTDFEAQISASLLGATAYLGSAKGRFTQIHGIRYKTSQYMLGALPMQGTYATWFIDYQTFMTYQLAPKWELSFLGNFSQNSYRFVPKVEEVKYGTVQLARQFNVFFDGQEKDLFRTYFGALSLNFNPSKKIKLSLIASAFNTSEHETYDIIGTYSLSEVDVNNGGAIGDVLGVGSFHEHARNQLSATVANISHIGRVEWGNSDIQWGATLQQEIIKDQLREWEYRDSASYSLPYSPTQVNMTYNLASNQQLSSTRLMAYLQDTYQFRNKAGLWTLNAGVRANYWNFNDEFLLSPRVSASLFPTIKNDSIKSNYSFRLAAGVYYQAPFYKEMRMTETDEYGNSSVILNTDIRAQRSFNFVFGYDHFFRLWNRPFKFTAELYAKPADRVISYYVDNVRVRYSGRNDAKAITAGFDVKLYGEFIPGIDSWIAFSWMRSKEDIIGDSYKVYSNTGNYLGTVEPTWIARPNEQRYNISLFFQDYFPNHPEYKVHLRLIWADGLPFGPPHSERYQAVYRSNAYRRVDIGASRGFIKGREKFMSNQNVMKELWLNLELFNLFNIKNINSYYWIADVYNQEYAVPNYLTKFRINFRISVLF